MKGDLLNHSNGFCLAPTASRMMLDPMAASGWFSGCALFRSKRVTLIIIMVISHLFNMDQSKGSLVVGLLTNLNKKSALAIPKYKIS